jgi:hypothetical protein
MLPRFPSDRLGQSKRPPALKTTPILAPGGVVVLPDMIDGNGNLRHLTVGVGKD